MDRIISKDMQTKMLQTMAVERINRNRLASVLGISTPTLRKILNSTNAVIVNRKTFETINTWLNEHLTIEVKS